MRKSSVLHLFIVVQLTTCALLLSAQESPVFVIDSLIERYNLNPYLSVWKDKAGKTTLEMLLPRDSQLRFQPASLVKLDDKKAVYWAKFSIQNGLKEPSIVKNWTLMIGEGSYVDYWIVGKDGNVLDHQITGELIPAHQKRTRLDNLNERILFSLEHNDPVTVFIRLQKINGHQPKFHLVLAREDRIKSSENMEIRNRDWFFFGFLFTMIVFYTMLFIGVRDRTYLYYSLFLTGASIFLLDGFAILRDAPLVSRFPASRMYLVYIAQAIMDISYIQFIRTYMDLGNLLPKWDKIYRYMSFVRWGFLLLVTLPFYHFTLLETVTDLMAIGFIFLYYLMVLIFLVPLYRSKDKKRAIFLAPATLLLILGIFGNAISITGGVGSNRLVVQIALISAITVFSLGLAYRMKTLLREEREAQRLKDLDDLKTKLYANITHEFRTPLTVIQGMAETLKKTVTDKNPKALEALNLIKRNGSNLLNLVNQILDLSKLESGRMELELKQGDIVEYLRYLMESFSSLAASKNIRLRFPTELKSFQMDFDAEKLRQVFTNLMSNAIKFTPEGGSIIVTAKKEGNPESERFILVVKDTGKGIPAADLPRIFDRYYQAGNSSKSAENTLKVAGTGIGLSLTKELVELMKGSITASSKLGKGTKFTVLLPVTHRAPVSDLLPESPVVTTIEQEPVPAEDYFLPTLSGPIYMENKPHLLIIEDNPDIVRYLSSLLEDNFNLEIAYDGITGENLALEHIPDIILSDVMMPGKDGFEVLDSLKNDQRTSHIPIVMLTAKTNVQDRIAGLKKGADAYLGKPFEEEELFAILQNLKEQSTRWQQYFTRLINQPGEEDNAQGEDQFIHHARQAVLDNLANEEFHGPELQKALAMGKTQLWRKLKALTGMSTTQFINYIRLQKAKELLETTTSNISEIAYLCGYKDPNYFSRLFVELFGLTPSDIRHRKAEA